MRNLPPLLTALVVSACSGEGPTNFHTLAPPTLRITGANRVVTTEGLSELEISASLRNPTSIRIQVAVGAQCPLFVRLFPDSTGEPAGSLAPSMACAPGASISRLTRA